MKLLGRAKVQWSVKTRVVNRTYRTYYTAEEVYVDKQLYVFGSREYIYNHPRRGVDFSWGEGGGTQVKRQRSENRSAEGKWLWGREGGSPLNGGGA